MVGPFQSVSAMGHYATKARRRGYGRCRGGNFSAGVAAFAPERDWLNVVITAFVLEMVLLSYAIGQTGGQ
jgi:hypothetical protein